MVTMTKHLNIHAEIAPGVSLYLDLLRVLAATAVLISHTIEHRLYTGWVPLSEFSHSAVVVFFVLSGIVISATAARPGTTLFDFISARSDRIYSVALPAIVLSALLRWIYAATHDGVLDAAWTRDGLDPGSIILAVTFLQQSWQDLFLPWNAPYWSICYEVWYYILFAILLFARPSLRWPLALVAACVAGPAILALFPVWWLGVEFTRRPSLSFGRKSFAFLAFFLSLAAIYGLTVSKLDISLRAFLNSNLPLYWRLHSPQRFLSDFVIGLLILVNLVAFRDLKGDLARALLPFSRIIRFVSVYTFSIYLYYFPLVMFWGRVFPNETNSVTHYLVSAVSILCITVFLGHFTEKKKATARSSNPSYRYATSTTLSP